DDGREPEPKDDGGHGDRDGARTAAPPARADREDDAGDVERRQGEEENAAGPGGQPIHRGVGGGELVLREAAESVAVVGADRGPLRDEPDPQRERKEKEDEGDDVQGPSTARVHARTHSVARPSRFRDRRSQVWD